MAYNPYNLSPVIKICLFGRCCFSSLHQAGWRGFPLEFCGSGVARCSHKGYGWATKFLSCPYIYINQKKKKQRSKQQKQQLQRTRITRASNNDKYTSNDETKDIFRSFKFSEQRLNNVTSHLCNFGRSSAPLFVLSTQSRLQPRALAACFSWTEWTFRVFSHTSDIMRDYWHVYITCVYVHNIVPHDMTWYDIITDVPVMQTPSP